MNFPENIKYPNLILNPGQLWGGYEAGVSEISQLSLHREIPPYGGLFFFDLIGNCFFATKEEFVTPRRATKLVIMIR
jgi:hypothetical protein